MVASWANSETFAHGFIVVPIVAVAHLADSRTSWRVVRAVAGLP